jgi:hypothetical protein
MTAIQAQVRWIAAQSHPSFIAHSTIDSQVAAK